MSYVLLIVEPTGIRESRSLAEGQALYDRMLAFSANLKERGLLTMGQSLRTDADGVRLRRRGGQLSVVDGPFAEAKEMVGGFFLLTCKSREEALAVARECPAAEWATVEVRELGPCFE
jgi:hypothetical protein